MTQDPAMRAAIAAMGRTLTPQMLTAVQDLFRAEQDAIATVCPPAAADLSYGPHARNVLDVYAPAAGNHPAPVLVWVHGGGFLRGDKRAPDNPYNAHMGRFAARNGLVGVVVNYRLAPEHVWPSGPEDLAAVMAWVKRHIAPLGGDPGRIIIGGTSAGAAHVAGLIAAHPGAAGAAGAILLSGLYGFTALEERDRLYYGPDPAGDAARLPAKALASDTLPLFVACAEFDPPRFQAETLGLMKARFEASGAAPAGGVVAGHNHYSISYHVGGRDTRLAVALLDFIRTCTAG